MSNVRGMHSIINQWIRNGCSETVEEFMEIIIHTLVSILTLQNAMIIAKGGMGSEMKTLATYSSAGIFALIVFVTVRSMIVNRQ